MAESRIAREQAAQEAYAIGLLHGLRLGPVMLDLLRTAPKPDDHLGLTLNDPDPNRRDKMRAAARRLERHGLLDIEQTDDYTRAYEPRRDKLELIDGRLYRAADPTRAHAVLGRNVVWRSPFGQELVLLSSRSLRAGKGLVRHKQLVRQAWRRAQERWPDDLQDQHRRALDELAALDYEAVLLDLGHGRGMTPAYPAADLTDEQRAHWHRAEAYAQHCNPDASATFLFDLAARFWRDLEPVELEALAGEPE